MGFMNVTVRLGYLCIKIRGSAPSPPPVTHSSGKSVDDHPTFSYTK